MDLVSMLETIRGNRYMLMAADSFSQYCQVYWIPNNMMEERQWAYKSMREVQGGMPQMNKPLTQNIQAGC